MLGTESASAGPLYYLGCLLGDNVGSPHFPALYPGQGLLPPHQESSCPLAQGIPHLSPWPGLPLPSAGTARGSGDWRVTWATEAAQSLAAQVSTPVGGVAPGSARETRCPHSTPGPAAPNCKAKAQLGQESILKGTCQKTHSLRAI